MGTINLTDELYMKKMDVSNPTDLWLARELDKDELIYGEHGYLHSIESLFKSKQYINREYLTSGSIYQAPYAIYRNEDPIGYMELSKYHEHLKCVYLCYALLDRYRGNGYATKTLMNISEKILQDIINDVQKVVLVIDPDNLKSQAVATRAGFISDGLSYEEHVEQGFAQYIKMKK